MTDTPEQINHDQFHATHEQEIARKRAEFEAKNQQIHQKHLQLEDEVAPMLNHLAAEAKEQAHLRDEDVPDVKHLPESMIAAKHHGPETHEPTFKKSNMPPTVHDSHAGKEYEAPMPPTLSDGATSSQHPSKSELVDPNAPAVPVQSHSLRKDG